LPPLTLVGSRSVLLTKRDCETHFCLYWSMQAAAQYKHRRRAARVPCWNTPGFSPPRQGERHRTRDLGGNCWRTSDSLSCFLHGPPSRAGRLADIEAAADFQAHRIQYREAGFQTTPWDRSSKKAAGSRDTPVESPGLGAVEVANVRLEGSGTSNPGIAAAYDVVTSRAVARLSVVVEYCVPAFSRLVGGRRHRQRRQITSRRTRRERRRGGQCLGGCRACRSLGDPRN
jgi:hypothetical protein